MKQEGKNGEHTSWNTRASRNCVICFGISLDSCIITFFFCSTESFLLTNEPASVAHILKKILLRPHITSSFCLISLFPFTEKFKSWLYSLSLLLRLPFSFQSVFYSHPVPWQTLFSPCCQIQCPIESRSSSTLTVIATVDLTYFCWNRLISCCTLLIYLLPPGFSFLVLAESSLPPWSLTGPCPLPRWSHPALWLWIPSLHYDSQMNVSSLTSPLNSSLPVQLLFDTATWSSDRCLKLNVPTT